MAQTISSDDLGKDPQSQLDQQNNNQQNGAGDQSSNNGQQTGQAGGGYQQQTGQPSGGNTNPNQQRGSGYTNIQKIVQANQGNKLGQTVGGGIQNVANQAGQALGQAQQNFQQQTANNTANTAGNQQLVTNVLNDPTAYAQMGNNDANSQQGSKFQQLISGQYGGPTSLTNNDQLQNQVGDVSQMGQLAQSPGGQIGLLQRFLGKPQYTQGEQALDQALLGQTGGSALQQAQQKALQLQNQLGRATTGAQEQGKEQGSIAQQFGQQVQGQLGTTTGNIQQQLQDKATQQQTQADIAYKTALQDLQSGKITQQEANQLGLTQGEQVFNVLQNANPFVSENPLQANAQNVASAQDYARIQALQQLAGGSAPTTAQDVFQKFSDPTQAGKFDVNNAVQYDKSGLQKAIDATQANYQQQTAAPEQKLEEARDLMNLVKQRDASGGQWSPQGQAIQQQINQKYPGASTNGWTRSDWAQANLQQSQTAYGNIINNLMQSGVLGSSGQVGTVNIVPDQQQSAYPAASQIPQGSS